jgi:hypothetical protein
MTVVDSTIPDRLLSQVINQLRADIAWRDFTAIEELLKFVPRENLIAYLPEEKQ